MVKRLIALTLLCVLAPVLFAQRRRAVNPAPPAPPANETPAAADFAQPLPGLPQSLVAFFNAGRDEFLRRRDAATGLGPVFNGRSCVECHIVPVRGGGSERMVTRVGLVTNGRFDPLAQFGGSLLQNRGIGVQVGSVHEFSGEAVPFVATVIIQRRSQPLFGLSLVDATPDATFVALAAQQAVLDPETAGRVSMAENLAAGMQTVGKFGWKAQVPTLFQFAGDAYLNELGITNPFFPDENCPSGDCGELQFNPLPGLNDSGEGTKALADFMTLLAAPPRGEITADATAGEAVFNRIGCNSCHVATMQTGPNPNPALDRVTYAPYSDFLLHDMGTLGDGIEEGTATGREMRTAPLWGLRVVTALLHDGRARTIEDAIAAHDGQGRASRDRFNSLDVTDRARLLAFLRSL